MPVLHQPPPLQALLSLSLQSACLVHLHTSAVPTHAPAAHTSSAVQALSSSHGDPFFTLFAVQSPVDLSQVFLMHPVSPAVGQVTTVAGFSLQVPLLTSQYSVPLQ